jgi:hypothetical protein
MSPVFSLSRRADQTPLTRLAVEFGWAGAFYAGRLTRLTFGGAIVFLPLVALGAAAR